ncbi:endoplasmic reticulum metallopeptidase 1-like [Elysia marginata]|uniref:Endoplasmic reticulum metallopeptidase 1-like n=1 Tax=Elysia marginata TaxID=1093978 RepID=A0AAV4GFB8_9GAST|nr:endoplasmic reticulum metallopeptidase 1-like [Elysia marginata]
MGRRGSEGNPDLVIAGLASLLVLMCLPYHIAFVYTHKRVGQVILVTSAVIMLGLTAVLCTPAGFPYSGSPTDTSPQRAMLVHFDRRFHSESGQVRKMDAGIWYMPVDRHSTKHLMDYAPSVVYHARQATCDGVYCGRPYLYPMLNLVDTRKTIDFPASHLNVDRVSIKLVERQALGRDLVKLSFAMKGPSHVTIFISEKPKAHIVRWSFGHHIPVEVFTLSSMTETTFFIYYSHSGNTTWQFSMDIQVEGNKKLTAPLINMGLAGHYLHGINQVSSDLLSLERDLPQWISPVTWTATYDEYVF